MKTKENDFENAVLQKEEETSSRIHSININRKLEIRKQLWRAIASFYLDTELTVYDYEAIAQIFKESNLSISTLKKIDLYEVFPVLKENLISPTGVWEGFDEAWLNNACTAAYSKRLNPFFRWKMRFYNRVLYTMRKDHWTHIEQVLALQSIN
ncbi:hypothetical protein [Leeuwenhoekiella sp. MAR_2009_132]|uniref:DUF7079 family protein n=1 Tax=Leeuwenhoekiella sp. MAR_2009_132 TaxID=1392489 RepID=UPI0019005F05|nr:hypothetical protein [Leeuwenhoekiella sp. MAR_2009_132]